MALVTKTTVPWRAVHGRRLQVLASRWLNSPIDSYCWPSSALARRQQNVLDKHTEEMTIQETTVTSPAVMSTVNSFRYLQNGTTITTASCRVFGPTVTAQFGPKTMVRVHDESRQDKKQLQTNNSFWSICSKVTL
eukprot:GHVS01006193.1.p1 GENE.GHVS01006193.1~~GHVS01006193.1.p1  ORF type:complete len:135 (+),score=4.22 GHVS01006193.1:69-473(+)